MDSSPRIDAVQRDQKVVDPNVLAKLPGVVEVLELAAHNESAWSAWAKNFRLDVRYANEEKESFFIKVSTGDHGKKALVGEFESTSAIRKINSAICPKPIGWGTFENDSNSHFYICRFYNFKDGVPKPEIFCQRLAELHAKSLSPDGKFGFHCTTYNGDIPQDNTWCDRWEDCFSNGLRNVLEIREARAGPNPELDALETKLFEKVIPRLLRPLESEGREIKPSLVHGDLWCGNAGRLADNAEECLIYDPAAFYAHNEYELGNWRPKRNGFTSGHFDAYHSHMPQSKPVDDYDDRNALYALRFELQAAALFPENELYVSTAIGEIRRLVEKHPKGYTGNAE